MLATVCSFAGTTKVVVIDTGLNKHKFIPGTNGMCRTGHKDITNTGIDDEVGHGTNISGIIHETAKDYDYCQVVIKYYTNGLTGKQETLNLVSALEHADSLNIDIVNISAGGPSFNQQEYNIIKKLLDKGVTIIAAAGNDGHMLNQRYCDLQSRCGIYNFYPASYDKRIIVVGNKYANGDIFPQSNYGELVDVWRVGVSLSGVFGSIGQTGTSQSTASFTGEYVTKISKKRRAK